MCNKSDKRNEQNDIEFIWTPKVSDGRETLKQTYSMNDFSYDEADQTIQVQQHRAILVMIQKHRPIAVLQIRTRL